MLKKILIGVVVVIVAAVGFVFTQPETFHVERTAKINAPVDVVFGLVNDMKARAAWYPWDRLDENMTRTYSDKHVGVGASYEWSGNDKVGTGRQEILESVSNQKVVDDLHFKTPFDSRNKAGFTFTANGDTTDVTWSLDGGEGFMARVMNIFMSMDDAVGKDFENGLKFLDEEAQKVVKAEADKKTADEAAAQASADGADGADATGEAIDGQAG